MSSKIIVLAVLALLAVGSVNATATNFVTKVGLTSATTVRFVSTVNAQLAATNTITLSGAAGATFVTLDSITVDGATIAQTNAITTVSGVTTLTITSAAIIATTKVIYMDCTFSGTLTNDAWSAVSQTDTAASITHDLLGLYVRKTDSLKYTVHFWTSKALASAATLALTFPAGVTAGSSTTCTVKVGGSAVVTGTPGYSGQVSTYTLSTAVAIGGKVDFDCTLNAAPTNIVWLLTPPTGITASVATSLNMINRFDVSVPAANTSASKALAFTISGGTAASGAVYYISMPTGYAVGSSCVGSVSTTGTLGTLISTSAALYTTGIKVTLAAAFTENDTLYVVCTGMTIPATPITTLTSWGVAPWLIASAFHPLAHATSYAAAGQVTGMTALVNAKGAAVLAPALATAGTGTGVFTVTISTAVSNAIATKYNNIVLKASDGTKIGFTAGVSSGTVCTVDGAAYTTSTANAADITTTMVIMRSAVAVGAIAAGTKLTITCTKMNLSSSAAATDSFNIAVEKDSANTGGAFGTSLGFDAAWSNAGQTVGTVGPNTLSVVDKAGTAFTLGAAPADYWINVNADQYLKISFAGVGTAVNAGSVITVTMPAAWAFDITNTKDNTTLKVAGTDVTAKYTIACASATVCTFTPKVNTDGAITVTDAVEILFGKVTRSGAVVANELVTVSMGSNTSGNQFYLPKSNSMGAKGSVMKASIAGKTLTGSVSGFENAVTASDSKTSTVTPDTTYTFTTTANDCTGSLPAGKAITSTQTTTVATLTMKSDATIADAAAAKLAVLDFSCKLLTVPATFATGKTVAVTRHSSESGTFDLSEDKGSSAASASSTVGVVLGAVFGVVGLAQLTL